MKFRTWKPSTTPIHSFFPKKQRYFTTSLFYGVNTIEGYDVVWKLILTMFTLSVLLWKQRTRQVKVSRILLAAFIRLILPYIVLSCLSLPHLVLPHMILSFRASLQSHHGPCVWPLSEIKLTDCVRKKNWYKELQDAPLAAVVGRLCRLPCWLVDIPEKWESFYPDYLDYSQNWSFFITTVCNGLNQPECEVLLLNYIEMFANLQQFKRWDQGDTTQK